MNHREQGEIEKDIDPQGKKAPVREPEPLGRRLTAEDFDEDQREPGRDGCTESVRSRLLAHIGDAGENRADDASGNSYPSGTEP